MLGNAGRTHAVAALAAALAGLSLLLPLAPAYDPWAWLVWGRELGGLDLDTSAGPSWKPLPVFVDVALAATGDAAPDLWLVVARTGWLLTLPLAWRVAARLAGGGRAGLVAGAVAALGVLLIEDVYTPWLRQFAGGLSEPLLVALCLLAIDRALSARHGQAIACGAAAAMIRPEAWPFLAAYAVWACRRDVRLRTPAVLAGAAVALVWFLPDLLGAGDPLEGAERARGLQGGDLADGLEVLERGFRLVPAALWPLALLGTLWRTGPWARTRRALAAGAVGWILLVAAMAVGGYAGLPRFMAPAGAAVCALAGVGMGALLVALRDREWARVGPAQRAALGLLIVAALAASSIPRAVDLPGDYREAKRLGELNAGLFDVAERAGPPPQGCGPAVTDELLSVTALAWRLDLSLARAVYARRPPRRASLAFAVADGPWRSSPESALGPVVAATPLWRAYRPCAAIAGVRGALR